MKYFLVPLGCATNKADTERIASVLESIGYSSALCEDEADCLGIVACSIRQSAIDRVIGRARNWNIRKNKEDITTFVSGCVLPEDEKRFLESFDFVVKLSEVNKLPQLLQQSGACTSENFWDIEPSRTSPFKALVPIQNGCDKFCTYCAVPYTRGRQVSRPSKEILNEVKSLIKQGYKQITLLGQNVNAYGLDKPEEELSFAGLLEQIGQLGDSASHKIWIHYTSPHPQDMVEEVFQVQAKHDCLADYLNFPLQSGDDEVLKRMNRRHTVEEYFDLLSLARRHMPDLTVSTDFIVGFCGESEEQFEQTKEALRRGKYDMAYIAQYSPRPGAVAEKRLVDDVSKTDKKRRDIELTEVLKETALRKNKEMIEKTVPVLVESVSRKPGKLIGRTQGLKSVEFESNNTDLIGQFIDVKITDCDPWRLFGECK
ncbi:MiaB/RimO family radical SAM methylthiotransferase [Patescibacteria group bacterium]